ncbi:hypothetical protein GCM10010191_81890 [Actinomadura vinacea]|uniref:Uncharacterized protein n=1 Tax=Actinomadura vinacea TaxID=115336 RepID=A0ABN3KAP9_9ACTN
MRALIMLAIAALIVVVAILVYYAVTDRKAAPPARWETHTESSGGVTTVMVRQVTEAGRELGRQTVASIPDGDPEWETRYHEAMAQARSRVAALQIEAD